MLGADILAPTRSTRRCRAAPDPAEPPAPLRGRPAGPPAGGGAAPRRGSLPLATRAEPAPRDSRPLAPGIPSDDGKRALVPRARLPMIQPGFRPAPSARRRHEARPMISTRRFWLAGALALVLGAPAARRRDARPQIFAAASLKNALDDVAAAGPGDTGKRAPRSPTPRARRSPSRSSRARRPTCSSPPTSTGWTTCGEKDLIRPDTRVNLLGNTLVLVAPADVDAAVDDRAGLRPRRRARRRPARDGAMSTRCRPANTARRR